MHRLNCFLLAALSVVMMSGGCGQVSTNQADVLKDTGNDVETDVISDVAHDTEFEADIDDSGADVSKDDGDAGDEGGSEDAVEDTAVNYKFVEFEWQQLSDDVTSTRMCVGSDDPESVTDKINIDCVVEGESFVLEPANPKQEIVVMAYNVERGFKADEMVAAMKAGQLMPLPDVLLVSEADRGCDRTANRYVLRDMARQLGMYFVYAVEFVELPRPQGSGGEMSATCEHGNGILSRYPLGNVKTIRHTVNYDWSDSEDQPRLGGRIAVTADVRIGESIVNVAAIHFESNGDDTWRGAQAREMIEHAAGQPHLFVIGGDFNCAFYSLDLSLGSDIDDTITPFLDAGYFDAHAAWPIENRITHPSGGFLLDVILGNGDMFSNPGMCTEADCGGLSDHLPVWATVSINR